MGAELTNPTRPSSQAMYNSFKFTFFSFICFLPLVWAHADQRRDTWTRLLEQKKDCVTWVSVTVRIEVSTNGRSYPQSERKLEALGTVLGEDGMIALSLHTMDPTDSIRARMRTQGDVNVDYTEVMILRDDGSEIPAKFALKDQDLDLAFVLPLAQDDAAPAGLGFTPAETKSGNAAHPQVLDEVVSLGKLGRHLYRQPSLRRGWVNAVIRKPRDYFIIENLSPGCPVFNSSGEWIGVSVYKKDGGNPSALITLPANEVMEIADQARRRSN